MKRFNSFLLCLLPLLSLAQVQQLKVTKDSQNHQLIRQYNAATARYDIVLASLPTDAVRSRKAGRVNIPYAPEAKRAFSPAQFGTDKYYDPNYRFSADFNPNLTPTADRRKQGVSLFSRFVTTTDEYAALPAADRFYYQTENELHGELEGAGYFESSLATLEARYNDILPSNVGVWTANIEVSNEWHQYLYSSGTKGFDSWAAAQNRSIVCEIDGQTRTLGQLYNSGLFEAEGQVRGANRRALLMDMIKARNPSGRCAFGVSMYQGEPKTNALSTTNLFQAGIADVTHIGGDSQGHITLNGRSHTVKGNQFDYENYQLDYFYYFNFNIARSDYVDIWINHLANTQNYPYIWSKIQPYHIVAAEKGHWQANRYRMANTPTQTVRPSIRMQEFLYEDDRAGIVDGQYPGEISRVPQAELQNSIVFGDYHDTPKIWCPPYLQASIYKVHRFLEGSTPGSGFHFWNAPGQTRLQPTTGNMFNHELHGVTAVFQARADMQPYEKFYSGSTLVADPLVQINQTGSYSAYSGADAFALGADGTRGTQKPSYIARYKANPSGGYRLLILGGMVQGFTTQRTDNIQFASGPLAGITFGVTLRGPSAQVFEFSTIAGDASGSVYTASFAAEPSLEKAGYDGRIVASVSTPPATTTAAPSSTSTTIAGGFADGSLSQLLALAPFVPDNNQVGSWANATIQYLENSQVKFGIHRSLAGVPSVLIDKRNGENLINTNRLGGSPSNPDSWDTGRSGPAFAVYGGPDGSNVHPFISHNPEQSTSQSSDDTGYNGVIPGSRYQDRSPLLYYQRKTVPGYGEVLYALTQAKQWSLQNVLTQYKHHAFYWLEGSNLRFTYIIENFRDDDQRKYVERQQEGPFVYLLPNRYHYKVEYSAGSVSDVSAPVPFTNGLSSPTSTGNLLTATNWMGAYNDAGYGVTLLTPYCSKFEGKQVISRNGTDPGTDDAAYIAAAPLADMDTPANTLWSGYLHVGTNDEFRSWLSSASVALRPFNFDFTGGRFQGWCSTDGRLLRENGNDVNFYLGDAKPYNQAERGNAVFNSPYGSWPATTLATLKFTMAVTGTSTVEIRWIKPGQTDNDAVTQRKTFPVTGDGVTRQYTVSMSGTGGWNGTISKVTLANALNATVTGNEKIKLSAITN